MFLLKVLSVAVYNHYKRIYHTTLPKGLVILLSLRFSLFMFLGRISSNASYYVIIFLKIYQMKTYNLFFCIIYVIELVGFNTRLGADSGISDVFDDDENVELEKSNVLLMGPTGSGITFTLHAPFVSASEITMCFLY